ncbi:UNVERIFIED_CONTAM: hypothetical protein Slati_1323800 [Sesamum latifolium]|uniref:GAG-pre-integrase domain-containing protein n=1 Tax=Sesamum latifolium TaxID=2727402 RepID=A0AAW2XHF9_9LAMI
MEAGESVHMAIQEKNKDQLSYVCYESNMVDIYRNTWWTDSDSTIHVTNSLQGLENLRKPVESERYIYSGNKMGSRVKAIRTCRLVLNNGFILVLEKTFYIPNFSRNLISVSRLVPYGYSFNFGDDITLFYNNHLVGNGTLSNGLYHINLQSDILYTLNVDVNAGIKRCVMNEDSSVLWHRRLGHISIERIKKLVNDGVLNTLDFTDFNTCVDCIKGKQTNVSKKGYFITFIDDYSRYMCIYFLEHKGEALNAFKVFKAEVEKQCDKQIKIVRSDRGGEYFGRYTERGQTPGPFAKFLAEQEKKLDPRTISGYFVGYAERSKGYRFYCPLNSTRIVESRNAKFLEDDLISGSDKGLSIRSNLDHSESQPSTSSNGLIVVVHNTPTVQTHVEQPIQTIPQVDDHEPVDPVVSHIAKNVEQPVDQQAHPENVDATLRRSTRIKRSAISGDYMIYL